MGQNFEVTTPMSEAVFIHVLNIISKQETRILVQRNLTALKNMETPHETIGDSTIVSSHLRPSTASRKRRHSAYQMYDHLEEMMYGFGDKWPPNSESVELVERIVANYVRSLCHRAKDVADVTGNLDKECFLYAVRKDRKKFTRIYTLLKVHEEIKKVAKHEELPIDANQDFPAAANTSTSKK